MACNADSVSETVLHNLSFQLSPGWEYFADPRSPQTAETAPWGGSVINPARNCVLHLRVEHLDPAQGLPDLARFLANFLTYHLRPIATDELFHYMFGGLSAYSWQYHEEFESGQLNRVKVWVIGNDLGWCFVNFQGPADQFQQELDTVEELLSSMRFQSKASSI